MNLLGNQADDWKYRLPTTTPGAWNGVIIHTDTPFPMMLTTLKKWTRFKDGLAWILSQSKDMGSVPTAEKRRIARLGVNIMQVYDDAKCYLKGFFNAIEAFCNLEGWQIQNSVYAVAFLEFEHDLGEGSPLDAQGNYPLLTPVTSELLLHVEALQILFAGQQPLMILIRPTDKGKLQFFCRDASCKGFGGATQYPDGTLTSQEGL
jgi:hypothetical protein